MLRRIPSLVPEESLGTFCVPGTIPDAGDVAVNKTNLNTPVLMELYIPLEGREKQRN